ncbi:MAG: hypothetical protein OXH31_06420 [Gammaproteobacteria bacterium]|nr:hypothetical protein [Gammaproteobacteria bacterium]
MKSRSEEEGRAWLAINSANDNIFKLFLKYLPLINALAIIAAVIMGVSLVVRDSPLAFWDWLVFIVLCASSAFLAYTSIKVLRKGVEFFVNDEGQEPLGLLSAKERRDYQIHVWLTTGIAALFVALVSLALIIHFNGVIRFGTLVWVVLAVGLVLTVCSCYWLVQRTRRLVSKLTAQLAEEHAPFSVEDSESL